MVALTQLPWNLEGIVLPECRNFTHFKPSSQAKETPPDTAYDTRYIACFLWNEAPDGGTSRWSCAKGKIRINNYS